MARALRMVRVAHVAKGAKDTDIPSLSHQHLLAQRDNAFTSCWPLLPPPFPTRVPPSPPPLDLHLIGISPHLASHQSSMLLRLRPLPMQSQRRVRVELPDQTVPRRTNGSSQHDAQRDQLRRDLLEGADALGDGVG